MVPTKKQVPEYLNVNIRIRKDLIRHWGGLVINNFSINGKTGHVNAENLTAPGFDFDVPDTDDEATFLAVTEMEKKKGEKSGPKKGRTRRTREKTTSKKPGRKTTGRKKSR